MYSTCIKSTQWHIQREARDRPQKLIIFLNIIVHSYIDIVIHILVILHYMYVCRYLDVGLGT